MLLLLRHDMVAGSPLPGFDIERLVLSPGANSSMLIETGDLLPARTMRAAVVGHYQHSPLVLYRDGEKVGPVVGGRWTSHLMAAGAPHRRWEVGLQLPVIVHQAGSDLAASGVERPDSPALGTPSLHLRFGVLAETFGNPFDLALQVRTGVPLGGQGGLAGDDGWVVSPHVGIGKRLSHRLRAGVELGLLLRRKAPVGGGAGRQDVGSQADFAGGVMTVGRGIRGEVVIRSQFALASHQSSAEAAVGARIPFGGSFEAFALFANGFGRTPGTPAFRTLVGVAFSTRLKKKLELLPRRDDEAKVPTSALEAETLQPDPGGAGEKP
jgi:hypothetical protein